MNRTVDRFASAPGPLSADAAERDPRFLAFDLERLARHFISEAERLIVQAFADRRVALDVAAECRRWARELVLEAEQRGEAVT